VEIVREFTSFVHERRMVEWDAGDQRNFAFDSYRDHFDWFLFLDSDELITGELRDELSSFVENPSQHFKLAAIRAVYSLFGRALTNTCSDTYHDRLVHRSNDVPIFTRSPGEVFCVRSRASVALFKSGYLHNVLAKGYIDWLRRITSYAYDNGRIDAQYFVDKTVREVKDKRKLRNAKIWLGPLVVFAYFGFYLFKRKCYRDGLVGVIFAAHMSLVQIVYPIGWIRRYFLRR
jgi:hypothetical protein